MANQAQPTVVFQDKSSTQTLRERACQSVCFYLPLNQVRVDIREEKYKLRKKFQVGDIPLN